jgi:hypothetical protein
MTTTGFLIYSQGKRLGGGVSVRPILLSCATTQVVNFEFSFNLQC